MHGNPSVISWGELLDPAKGAGPAGSLERVRGVAARLPAATAGVCPANPVTQAVKSHVISLGTTEGAGFTNAFSITCISFIAEKGAFASPFCEGRELCDFGANLV